MQKLELGVLARATGATIVGGPLPKGVVAVGTDSRSLPSPSLFVALRGERFDGHEYVRQACGNGAVAALVDHAGNTSLQDIEVPRLVVEDTLYAYGHAARALRDQRQHPVVALTGSNGKTSTKELIAEALGAEKRVHATKGNFNNRVGVPKTIFDAQDDDEIWVLEMGMNEAGEIATLMDIGHPNVGVVTNVSAAHLEGLGTIEAVAEAKGELFLRLRDDGVAVINADDPWVVEMADKYLIGQRIITVGKATSNTVCIQNIRIDTEGTQFEALIEGKTHVLRIPVFGAHQAYNAGLALGVVHALWLDIDRAANALTHAKPQAGRFLPHRLAEDILVVDDTYNANPSSVCAAMDTLSGLSEGRKIAVLGSMFELGERSDELHQRVGAHCQALGFDMLVAVGPSAQFLVSGAPKVDALVFEDSEDAKSAVLSLLRPKDAVLVKGSRSMKMERIVDALIGENG